MADFGEEENQNLEDMSNGAGRGSSASVMASVSMVAAGVSVALSAAGALPVPAVLSASVSLSVAGGAAGAGLLAASRQVGKPLAQLMHGALTHLLGGDGGVQSLKLEKHLVFAQGQPGLLGRSDLRPVGTGTGAMSGTGLGIFH